MAQGTHQKITAHFHVPNIRLLEIGSGSGRVTKLVAEEASLTVGLEPDEELVRQGAADLPRVHFVMASGLDLPFRSNCFDAVLFSLSLHHHRNPDEALAGAARVATPDGRLLVLEPMAQGEIQRFCNIFENEDHRLERAQTSLLQRKTCWLCQEKFSTQYSFDDFEDLSRYAFNYYKQPFDAAKQDAMRDFLGSKVNQRPLIMTDTLQLTVLKAGKLRKDLKAERD